MPNQVLGTNVTTGRVRLSYVNLFKPRAAQPGQEEKYSVTILLPKSDTATKARIDAAIEAAKQKGLSDKWNGVAPQILLTPIHDGDGIKENGDPYGPECKGHWVFTASSKVDFPPEVVDQYLNRIINQSEVYSGCYARVNVNFFPYGGGNTGFKKGVGVGLGPVQKIADGEPLGSSAPTAESVFEVMESGTAEIKVNPITGLPM